MTFRFGFHVRSGHRIYLDHAAATPVRPEVLSAMQPFFSEEYGNPGAVHKEGVYAKKAVETARELVARTLHVRPTDVTFTSGGTESNNLILLGHIEELCRTGIAPDTIEILITATEHPSIREACAVLKQKGVRVTTIPVDEGGRIDVRMFTDLLTPHTRMVSTAYANSETGVVQDLGKISRAIRAYEKKHGTQILFHTDASQAPLWLSCVLEALGVDAMTLDAGKCYGPKGVGVLVHRPRVQLSSIVYGGGQEGGLRSGTENVPLVVGAALAFSIAQRDYESRSNRIRVLRDMLSEQLRITIPDLICNGSPEHRLPNTVHISLPGVDTEFAVITLDRHGIAASTKSACGSGSGEGSHVILAMTGDENRARSTIRFSLGEVTTKADIEKTVTVLADHVAKMRKFQEKLTA